MDSGSQEYCLRWNNQHSKLISMFEHFFETESFTDVTLACDGSSIKCHKMVLAACSSYFKELFLKNECPHPIVILMGVKMSEMKVILDYMYKGEVNRSREELDGLRKVAETLKIPWLDQVEDEDNNGTSPIATPISSNPSPYQHSSSIVSSSMEFHHDTDTSNYACSPSNSWSSSPLSSSVPAVPDDSMPLAPNEALYSGSNHMENSTPCHFQAPPEHGGVGSYCNKIVNYENTQNVPIPYKKRKFMGTNEDNPIPGGFDPYEHNAVDSQRQSPSGHYQHLYPHHEQQLQSLWNQNTPRNDFSFPFTTTEGVEWNNETVNRHQEFPDHYMDHWIQSVESDKIHEYNPSVD